MKQLLLMALVLFTGPLQAADPISAPPVRIPVLKLFTDQVDGSYTHPYPEDEVKCEILFKQKKRWVEAKLRGTDQDGFYLGVGLKDLSPYLEKGALQFYIRGNKGGETLGAVGFTMANDGKNKFNFNTSVPLGDYCIVTTKWQLVTIPLSEFPITGKHIVKDDYDTFIQKILHQAISISGDQVRQCRFTWDKVIELQFEHNPSADMEAQIEIANVVILPSYKVKTIVREKEAIQ